jgi:hypothetical protein
VAPVFRFLARRAANAAVTLVGASAAVFAIMAANECPSGMPIDEPLMFRSENRWDESGWEVAPRITYRWGCTVSTRDTQVLYDSAVGHEQADARAGPAAR